MSRGGKAGRDAVLGAHAWAYMRRNSGYREAWAAHAAPPRFENADIPIRLQTEADLLAEADWALLAWEDPGAEAWRSPFWSGIPMLIGEPDPEPWPDPAPLLPLLAGAGARVEGLRLLDGRFVLKAELGNLHTWLLKNWPTRNLVIHGSLGHKIDFSEPSSIPYIGDADDLAVMLAAEPGEKTISSWESIDVQDLVPLTEEAQQVKSYLMQVHMMVSRNGVGRFPIYDE